jgi:porphobilinogen synthase
MRSFVRETRLSPEGFVYPLFVCPGEGVRKEVRSMPGVFNLSVDEVVKECAEVKSLGIPSVILFGLPESKDEVATDAWSDHGIVQKAARAIKREVPGLLLMGDVCLCEYMSHGHCGIVASQETDASKEVAEFLSELEAQGKRAIAIRLPKSGGATTATALATAPAVATLAAEDYEILNDPTLELLARTAVA